MRPTTDSQGEDEDKECRKAAVVTFLAPERGPTGDRGPKPVAFPDPVGSTVEIHGICCLALEKIIELKLASGVSNPGRMRHLADVQELIRHLGLGTHTAERLDPFVREKFYELSRGVNENRVEP